LTHGVECVMRAGLCLSVAIANAHREQISMLIFVCQENIVTTDVVSRRLTVMRLASISWSLRLLAAAAVCCRIPAAAAVRAQLSTSTALSLSNRLYLKNCRIPVTKYDQSDWNDLHRIHFVALTAG